MNRSDHASHSTRIGVDFDNTIICYDKLFHRVACEQSLIPADLPATKRHVRDCLRQCGKEDAWTEMQGYVYGARMHNAVPFPGVLGFFARCRVERISACIISHKTRYPYRGPRYDLHRCARDWLKHHGFYDQNRIGLSSDQIYFEPTRRDKHSRIAEVGCSHFIDDLPEFLTALEFPSDVVLLLFDPGQYHLPDTRFHRVTSWLAIEQAIFGNSHL
ncbi:MAG: haloacid dehalogenase-like hydrolase [Candidatus Poribacteria bacterium]|nr:haloacid dehalogenase-like hydrolase [Candidatus Poribacteria bacterium]